MGVLVLLQSLVVSVDVLLFLARLENLRCLRFFRSLDLVVLNASFAQPHSAVGGGLFRKPRALLLRRLHPNIDIDLCNRYNVAATYPRQTHCGRKSGRHGTGI